MAIGAEGCQGPYDDQATVTITVQPVNDAPTAVGDSFQFVWNQTLNIAGPGVLANDADPDGDDLTAIVATAPVRGHLTLAANGGFSYTPTAGSPCPGTADAFSYRASDGSATSPARVVVLSPAALPCPTPFVSPSPVPPTPSPTPPPTATPEPTPSPSASAEPSPTAEPSASASPSVEPSAAASPSPTPSEAPEPVDEEGGVSLPVLLVLVLLAVLVAFGAAYYVPRWVEARRTGGEPPEI
jgi:hypothetical protein